MSSHFLVLHNELKDEIGSLWTAQFNRRDMSEDDQERLMRKYRELINPLSQQVRDYVIKILINSNSYVRLRDVRQAVQQAKKAVAQREQVKEFSEQKQELKEQAQRQNEALNWFQTHVNDDLIARFEQYLAHYLRYPQYAVLKKLIKSRTWYAMADEIERFYNNRHLFHDAGKRPNLGAVDQQQDTMPGNVKQLLEDEGLR